MIRIGACGEAKRRSISIYYFGSAEGHEYPDLQNLELITGIIDLHAEWGRDPRPNLRVNVGFGYSIFVHNRLWRPEPERNQ